MFRVLFFGLLTPVLSPKGKTANAITKTLQNAGCYLSAKALKQTELIVEK